MASRRDRERLWWRGGRVVQLPAVGEHQRYLRCDPGAPLHHRANRRDAARGVIRVLCDTGRALPPGVRAGPGGGGESRAHGVGHAHVRWPRGGGHRRGTRAARHAPRGTGNIPKRTRRAPSPRRPIWPIPVTFSPLSAVAATRKASASSCRVTGSTQRSARNFSALALPILAIGAGSPPTAPRSTVRSPPRSSPSLTGFPSAFPRRRMPVYAGTSGRPAATSGCSGRWATRRNPGLSDSSDSRRRI